jgi:hypothetical protein
MNENEKPQNDELKQIQVATARVEYELKKLELENRPGWLGKILTNPAFVAAVVTTLITATITGTTYFYSQFQARKDKEVAEIQARKDKEIEQHRTENQKIAEETRYKQELDKSILLGIVNPGEPTLIASKLKLFIDAGLLGEEYRQVQEKLESRVRDEILSDIILASHQLPLKFRMNAEQNALLSPVSLHDLNLFIRQNYSRELLFWLFADTVELITDQHRIGFHYDPPNDYGCAKEDPKQRCFREWVEIAVITGLTVEAKTIPLKVEDQIMIKEYSRFCFDPVLAKQGQRAMDPARLYTLKTRYLDIGLKPSPQCNDPWSPGARGREGETDTLLFNIGPYVFKILTRSTNSIYQFLGQLLRQKRDPIPPAPGAYISPLEEAGPPTLSTQPEDPYLLTILPEQPGVRCFARSDFSDGSHYCVPEHGADNTKRIFSLLAELAALQSYPSRLSSE